MNAKFIFFCGTLACACALDARADAAVGFKQTDGVTVPEGETVSAGTVVLGDAAKFYKAGGGTLSIDAAKLQTATDGRITVLEGALDVTMGTADFTTPPAICQEAQLWMDMSSIVTTNGVVAEGETAPVYASRWYDVRETNTSSPDYIYAVPQWYSTSSSAATLPGVDPVVQTFAGKSGVYFGGSTSGQYMRWYKDGAQTQLKAIRNLFIVHGVTNTWGQPVGYVSESRTCPFVSSIAQSTPGYSAWSPMCYARADICIPQASMRAYLDGERVDPFNQAPRKGWQMLELDYFEMFANADNFFRSGFETIRNYRQGGDYLGEVLVFTNQLSEAERVSVERYLLAKWNLPANGVNTLVRTPCAEMSLATNTSATVTVADGSVTPPLAFTGAGSAVKDGEGVMSLGPTDGRAWGGDFTWNAGALRLKGGRLPPFDVASGEKYTFSGYYPSSETTTGRPPSDDNEAGLTCVKSSDAGAGIVELASNGWLRVRAVSNNVRCVKVGTYRPRLGSVLQLEGRVRKVRGQHAAGGAVRATFPNGDFEQPITITEARFDRANISQGDTAYGWTARTNIICIMCTQAPRSAKTWSQWLSATPPRTGTNILQLVSTRTASTTVQVPCAGRWELSFDAASRYSYTRNDILNSKTYYGDMQPQLRIVIGQTWDSAVTAGVVPLGNLQFTRYRVMLPELPAAGSYELGIVSPDASGWDGCAFLDNFEMTYVAEPEEETVVEVPNGNFDDLERPPLSEITPLNPVIHARYCTLNQAKNWTLSFVTDELPAWGDAITNGVVGFITGGTPVFKHAQLEAFPFSDGVRGGAALMFASTGGRATSSSFTLPAGTYRLRANAKRWSNYWVPYPNNEYVLRQWEKAKNFVWKSS